MERRFSLGYLFGSRRGKVEQANFDFRRLDQIENEVREELLRDSGMSMEKIMLYLFPLVVLFAVIVV